MLTPKFMSDLNAILQSRSSSPSPDTRVTRTALQRSMRIQIPRSTSSFTFQTALRDPKSSRKSFEL